MARLEVTLRPPPPVSSSTLQTRAGDRQGFAATESIYPNPRVQFGSRFRAWFGFWRNKSKLGAVQRPVVGLVRFLGEGQIRPPLRGSIRAIYRV